MAAMLFLDLDDFKSVNDTYGHAAGDLALQTAADVLRQNIRLTDYAAPDSGGRFPSLLQYWGILCSGRWHQLYRFGKKAEQKVYQTKFSEKNSSPFNRFPADIPLQKTGGKEKALSAGS